MVFQKKLSNQGTDLKDACKKGIPPFIDPPTTDVPPCEGISLPPHQPFKDRGLPPSMLWKQIVIAVVISLMQLPIGGIHGFTGIILPSITDPTSGDFHMNSSQASVYASMLVFGVFVGSFISAPFNVRCGQRVALILSMPLSLTGWLISSFSNRFWLQIFSRSIIGVHFSVIYCCSMTYLAETSHSSARGRVLAINEMMIQMGFLLVSLLGSTTLNWRVVGVLCGLTPLVVPLIVLFFLPDSPRWLAVMGRPKQEIDRSLRYFRGERYDIEEEYDEIQEDISKTRNRSSAWEQFRALKEESIAKRLAFLAYLNFSCSLTGNHAVLSFAVVIFKSADTGINVYLSTILCSLFRVVGSLLYISIVDHLGRKSLSLVSLVFASSCTALLGLFFYLNYINYDASTIFWLPLVSMLLFQVSICVCLPILRLLRSEILPNSVRSLGMNLLASSSSLGSYIVVITYLTMVEKLGSHWTFWIYSLNSIMMVVVVYSCVPETKGKTLEEIAKLF